MPFDSGSPLKSSRMQLRADITKQFEHWDLEMNRKIKDCMKELKGCSDSSE